MRDRETIEMFSGRRNRHLVLSSLNTMDAPRRWNNVSSFYPTNNQKVRERFSKTFVHPVQRLLPKNRPQRPIPVAEILKSNPRTGRARERRAQGKLARRQKGAPRGHANLSAKSPN